MKICISFCFALMAFLLSSCGYGGGEVESRGGRASGDIGAECVYTSIDDGACRPNLHRFFGNPRDYLGIKVSVSAFATYSSRGSMLIYPESVSACNALDFSAIEVFTQSGISKRIEDRLRTHGVAQVVVTGQVSGVGKGGLPVIGRIEKAAVSLTDGSGIVLLESPRKIEAGEVTGHALGKSVIPSCLN